VSVKSDRGFIYFALRRRVQSRLSALRPHEAVVTDSGSEERRTTNTDSNTHIHRCVIIVAAA